ncbi:hypothetical protein EV426DRAFT_295219 [Tirmania nivea]|nr:hypothetical protein EV426DRAFT_295219 [Tirmania nivea]
MHIALDGPKNVASSSPTSNPQYANQTTLQFPTAIEIAIMVEVGTSTYLSITRTLSVPTTALLPPSTTTSTPTTGTTSLPEVTCPNAWIYTPTLHPSDVGGCVHVVCDTFADQQTTHSPPNKAVLVAAILPPFIVAGGALVLLAGYLKYRRIKQQREQVAIRGFAPRH